MKFLIKCLSAAAASALLYAGMYGISAFAEGSDVTSDPSEPTSQVSTEISETISTSETTVVITTEISKTISATETQTETTTASTTISTTVSTVPSVTVTTPSGLDEGWNNINGKWFYCSNGTTATGVVDIDGEAYLFAANGALKTGWQTVHSVRKYFDKETHNPVYDWVKHVGNMYYVDKQLGKLTGLHDIENNSYVFDDSGIMKKGFALSGNYMYYCGDDGIVLKGDDKKTPIVINGISYIISPKGRILRGWQTVNGIRTYYDCETAQPVYGWLNYNGKLYYTDKTLGKYTGNHFIGIQPYRFDDSGIIITGLQKFTAGDFSKVPEGVTFGTNGITCFYNKDGSWATGMKTIGKDTYFFGLNGYMQTGWQTISKNKYYFGPDGKKVTGIVVIDGKTYNLGTDGIMQTGMFTISGSKYFFGSDGAMQTGWQIIDKHRYYFGSDGKMQTGWLKTANGDYYLGSDGIAKTGFTMVDTCTYYFDSNGKKCTGWQTIDGKKYYFDNDGIMVIYRHKIDNVDYLFYSNGVLATDGNQIIVVKALSQLGNVGGQPYWTWWGFNFRIEWCACFVSWCANQCGYTQNGNIPEFISCRVGINFFKEHGQWKGRSYKPKSGDFIFFDWEPDGVADHIGIVDYYEDGMVYTVEGNSSDTCRTRSYPIDDSCIFGFAAPNYKK